MRTLFLALLSFSPIFAAPELSVVSATARYVELRWTGAAPVSLERRVLGTTKYLPLATAEASFRDATIDALTTYQYRVGGSNEVTVGPPPTGYSVAIATPKTLIDSGRKDSFARSLAMELDANGDPAFLYTLVDPSGNDSGDVENWFLHWDRAHWRWQPPVKAATSKDHRKGVTLARDPETNAWATVVENGAQSIELYISSDDGATWSRKHQVASPESQVLGKAVGLGKGQVFWAYHDDSKGLLFLSGKLQDDPSKWKTEPLPILPETEAGSSSSFLTLAVDPAGVPGVAYFCYGPNYTVNALYWRPGFRAPVKIMDSDNVQNDFHEVDLHYSPHAHFVTQLSRQHDGGGNGQLWLAEESTPNRITPGVLIPGDGGHHSLDAPARVVYDSKHRGAVLYRANGGQGDDKCGRPKLARTTGAGWTTCSPNPAQDHDASPSGYGLGLRFAANDKLYVGWSSEDAVPRGPGLLLWREP